jgi:hypothetical protein
LGDNVFISLDNKVVQSPSQFDVRDIDQIEGRVRFLEVLPDLRQLHPALGNDGSQSVYQNKSRADWTIAKLDMNLTWG